MGSSSRVAFMLMVDSDSDVPSDTDMLFDTSDPILDSESNVLFHINDLLYRGIELPPILPWVQHHSTVFHSLDVEQDCGSDWIDVLEDCSWDFTGK